MANPTVAEPTKISSIEHLLTQARSRLDRVPPAQLGPEIAAGALVIDIRPAANRFTEGALPGAIPIERIHLEWRLDPTSPHRISDTTPERRIIIVCNDGYASSLAAVTLHHLGLHHATDLAGGYRAWRTHHNPPPPPAGGRVG